MGSSKGEYIPYVPPEKVIDEFTIKAVVLGVVLSIVMGAANAYLGLKAGMTVSASIPAAVISMAILRGILKKGTILENNIVQTIASAGEALAAGVIFTIPALILLGYQIDVLRIFFIASIGGILGVVFMIPLRHVLIVKEHGVLPYPEGVACAEVLIAGDQGGVRARYVFEGLGVGAGYKVFVQTGVLPELYEAYLPGVKGAMIGFDLIPALAGVGYIIGPRIGALVVGGGMLGWLVFAPILVSYGYAADPWEAWARYVRYIGVGAVLMGGLISLGKILPTVKEALKVTYEAFKSGATTKLKRTELDMNPVHIGALLVLSVLGVLAIALTAASPGAAVLATILAVIFAFIFVSVSSRIVGIVGSSSNPVSGMTIGTLLISSLVMKAVGITNEVAALFIGAIVCIAAAVAGDISQDLKTGFLVGATPKWQQIGQILGVIASATVIGSVVYMLHAAYGIGSELLPAPQANAMKAVVEGVFRGTMPWELVFAGAVIAIILELIGLPALPFAVGLYLPIHLGLTIGIGSIVRVISDKKFGAKVSAEQGVLYASGMIAGDAIMGILFAGLITAGIYVTSPVAAPPEVSFILLVLVALSVLAVLKK